MTVTIQELQGALRQHIDAGLDDEDAIRRPAIQFPDVKAGDVPGCHIAPGQRLVWLPLRCGCV